MTKTRVETPAAALARLYDVDLLEDPGDLDLYLALAARTGGPVLELGAGTGRVALALAEAGHAVTAVDSDSAALDRLRARLGTGDPLPGQVEVVAGDIVGLELAGPPRFRLAIVALNTLLMLGSRQAQRAAFDALARHLLPEGLAVVDVSLPSAQELGRYDGRLGLEYVRRDPETGSTVAKTVSAEHDETSGILEVTSIFEEGEPGEPARRWIRHDRLRLVGSEELRDMALAVGFQIEALAGGYGLEPLGTHDDRVILVARRRTRAAPGSLL